MRVILAITITMKKNGKMKISKIKMKKMKARGKKKLERRKKKTNLRNNQRNKVEIQMIRMKKTHNMIIIMSINKISPNKIWFSKEMKMILKLKKKKRAAITKNKLCNKNNTCNIRQLRIRIRMISLRNKLLKFKKKKRLSHIKKRNANNSNRTTMISRPNSNFPN